MVPRSPLLAVLLAGLFVVAFSAAPATSATSAPATSAPAASAPANLPVTGQWAGARWARDRLLFFDPAGHGRIAVVLGDLSTARRVAVIVPGSDVDLARFDEPGTARRPYGMARALRAQLDATGGRSDAVVAWLGYDTPVGWDAATGAAARAGAAELRQFLGDLRTQVRPGTGIVLIGHSYGAVVAAQAAPGLPITDLVLLASPGARANSVAALHTQARVWAATAPTDWIRHVPHVRIGDLGHGTDPAATQFGALPLPTERVTGHGDYFRAGAATLPALAAVVQDGLR